MVGPGDQPQDLAPHCWDPEPRSEHTGVRPLPAPHQALAAPAAPHAIRTARTRFGRFLLARGAAATSPSAGQVSVSSTLPTDSLAQSRGMGAGGRPRMSGLGWLLTWERGDSVFLGSLHCGLLGSPEWPSLRALSRHLFLTPSAGPGSVLDLLDVRL